MDKKIIKKYVIITIAIVVLFQLVMLLLRCSVDVMNIHNNDIDTNIEKVSESVKTINETETQIKKKIDREFRVGNMDSSFYAMIEKDDLWQEMELTAHFLNKYKSRFDIIPELKYSKRGYISNNGNSYYDKKNPNDIITTVGIEFDDISIDGIDFDEPIGFMLYEMRLNLTENKELDDIEILSKRPFTTEEYLWGHTYPPEINSVEDLAIACGGKVESQEYFKEDYMTENSEIVLNGFSTIDLVDINVDLHSQLPHNIKWYADDGTFKYKYRTYDGEKKGEWNCFAEYKDGIIIYYKVVFELDDDRKIKYLEYIPIEKP